MVSARKFGTWVSTAADIAKYVSIDHHFSVTPDSESEINQPDAD